MWMPRPILTPQRSNRTSLQNMIAAGATEFTECGPGKALQGMIVKIAKGNEAVSVNGVQSLA